MDQLLNNYLGDIKMRGLARIEQDVLGWVDIELDECGPYDAICKPLAMANL